MYTDVVVPLDGSELAEGVLCHVAEVVRGRGSCIHLLSIAPLGRGAAPLGARLPSPADGPMNGEQVERDLTRYLEGVASRIDVDDGRVEIEVRFGRPADEILAFAGEAAADLVVMSTHGRSGIGRWVYGGVAERVMRGAQCPLLLIRAGMGVPHGAYRHILVPLDCSEPAEQVLPCVKALVQPGETHVHLVSVLTAGLGDRTVALLTSSPPGLHLSASALDVLEVELLRYLRSVATVLRDRGATVHLAVRRGSPADEVLAHAAEVGADLVCMTTHGLSGVSRWVYGNVAAKVLQGAQSPVLLVHPQDPQRASE